MTHPHLSKLLPYPFERLNALLAGVAPPADLPLIPLTIGEPKQAPAQVAVDALSDALGHIGQYPATKGLPALREAIAAWLGRRFSAMVNADTQVLPVNGTREALFAFAQATVEGGLVLMPNPGYQIYEGAAFLAGAQPFYVQPGSDWLLNLDSVDEATWQQCQLIYVCSPGNPTGSVETMARWQQLIELADRYDFIIAADECYSEIFTDDAPVGLLQACAALGRDDFSRCVVFHSLSKRSNLPGLRSGFVAGDAALMSQFLKYRTYHGCAMGLPNQLASIAAWQDEAHVEENRRLYRERFDAVVPILAQVLPCRAPSASFYLWLDVGRDGAEFARELFAQQHVKVLPGAFLGRAGVDGRNPAEHYVRLSLVADLPTCVEAAERIVEFVRR